MNDLIYEGRNAIVTIVSVILAYFAPINDMVFVVFFLFFANMLVGLFAGILVDNESFDLKKFFHCILETFFVYMIILAVFLLGEKMNNMSGAEQCISGIVYACIYFYSVNICRNLHKIVPESKVIAFIYYVVSFEFVKKVQFLQDFQKFNKKEKLTND